jgi:hypothetical protein
MGPSNLDQISGELNVGSESIDILDRAGPVVKSSKEFEEFIKQNIKKDFGLIKNPAET